MGNLQNIAITNIGTTGSTVNLSDSDSEANYTNGKITFSNWSLELPEGKTAAALFTKITGKDENDDPIFDVVTGNKVFLAAVADGTAGATVSVLTSEERRVGTECVRTCRSGWHTFHTKKNNRKYI